MNNNTRRAFFVDPQARERPAGTPAAMGIKAYNLARMAAIGLPVPHAFVLGTGFCPAEEPQDPESQAELQQVLTAYLRRLERATGLSYGGSRRPLLLSVRLGAPVSTPGTMDTILNVGLNETTLRGLLRTTGNPRLAWDSYRRLIHAFAEVVDLCPLQPFDALLADNLDRAKVSRPQELDARALSKLTREYLALYRKLVGRNFPQDPVEQLRAAIQAVYRAWNGEAARSYRRAHELGENARAAVTVQRMVFGNAGGTSGSGVAFTRDPGRGARCMHMDFMFNAQGEDVVSGRHAVVDTAELAAILPAIERKVADTACALEAEFKDMQEFEFTVQDEVLYLLQTRPGTRTALAELRIAVDQVQEGLIEPGAALARLAHIDLDALQNDRVQPGPDTETLCSATSAGVGIAVGAIALDAEKARDLAARGPVILVRPETGAPDTDGLVVATGLLTARGGRTSHAAVVSREMNKVALVGCAGLTIDLATRTCTLAGERLQEGDVICLDANTGRVLRGSPRRIAERPEADIALAAGWRTRRKVKTY